MKYALIIIFFQINFLYCQPNQDARMLGLNGAYTTLVDGYNAVGINPANLAIYRGSSINMLNLVFGIGTNSLSIANYNAFNGSNMEDSTDVEYYPKADFYNSFNGRGLRILHNYSMPISLINFSINQFAFTSQFNNYIDIGVPNGFLDLMFYGNPIEKKLIIDMEQYISLTNSYGLTYAHLFDNFSVGITMKYILGLFYMGMESIENPNIVTEITGFNGKNQYLIEQAIGGLGKGLDVGFSTIKSKTGYKFGMSIINLVGDIEWTKDNFIRGKLEPSLINNDYYLRPNEFMYINMVMDSVTGTSFNSSGEPSMYYEMYKVVLVNDLNGIEIDSADLAYVVKYEDSFLLPSGGKYKLKALIGDGDIELNNIGDYSENSKDYSKPFKTRYPMYFRMGMSRKWDNEAVVIVDLITGFSNRFVSSSEWKLSLGTEILRFKDKFFRLGYAFGGLSNKSMSLGYGTKIGNLYFDIGILFNGGLSLETAKGVDFGLGLTWKKDI